MAERRRDERVTLMYMAGHTGQLRRFGVRRAWLRRAAAALVTAVALLGIGIVDYTRVRRAARELPGLRSEAQAQREQLAEYARRLEEISRHLARVAEFDRKLRVIAQLAPADPLPLPGVGGLQDGSTLGGTAGAASGPRELLEILGQLTSAAQTQASSLEGLLGKLEDQTARLGSTPSVAPAKGWITSTFGYRVSPFTGSREFHPGLDIASRMRTPVLAPADGVVSFVGTRASLGQCVVLQHGYGLETLYGHLAETQLRPGQRVARGARIGLIGNSGRSTGPHLHYQIEVSGKPVDPQNYILD